MTDILDDVLKPTVHLVQIAHLKIDEASPRRHSDRKIKQLARAILRFKVIAPVLYDKQGRIIAGEARLRAAQLAGLKVVPAICIEHLTEAQIKAYRIADNKFTLNASWDEKRLAEQFKELLEVDLDLCIDTGFDLAEIDFHIDNLDGAAADAAADKTPPIEAAAVSKAGDLWILGEHRVICGNSLESETYRRLMDGSVATLICTDCPFNVKIRGHVSGNGQVTHREFAMASGEMDKDEFIEFLTSMMRLCAANSVDGSIHMHFMDWRHSEEILAAGGRAYTALKNLCVWVKDAAGLGSFYRSQHELIFVFKKGTAPHVNNIQLGRFGRNRSNVWNYPSANSFSRGNEEGNLLHLHPTVKPVAMIADVLLDCSNINDIVLDPFLGSGTCLMAAQRTGRRCRGIELDPLYVDVAIRRWQNFTGGKAKHAVSGRSFNELEAELQITPTQEKSHG